MKIKKRISIWGVIRETKLDRFVYFFLAYVAVAALIILYVEPDIHTYGDALWYCYAAATTIGFGDVVVVTLISRLLSVLLSIIALLLISLITGVIVYYYTQKLELKREGTLGAMFNKLENLEDLSKDELKTISWEIKNWRENHKK